MKQYYPIYHQKTVVGDASLIKEGMYWYINCCCKNVAKKKFKILLEQQSSTIDLGLCVPTDNTLYLRKRIPVKTIGQGSMKFILREIDADICYSIQIPFHHISKIPFGFLKKESGQLWLCINEVKAKQGSDQSPKYHC